jgi:uncharacterized membrane protein
VTLTVPRFREVTIRSFEAKILRNRKFTERLADDINRIAGNFSFFVAHVIFFGAWVVANQGLIPGVTPIDPYPFSFLTMLVSLEAIFLSIFVLMSQNRQSTVASLREEIHLQVNQIAEREVTKALQLISEIHEKTVGKKKDDPELNRMLKTLDTARIEATLEKQLEPSPMVIAELLEKAESKILGKK